LTGEFGRNISADKEGRKSPISPVSTTHLYAENVYPMRNNLII
jgi:hypothetical protein